MSVLVNEILPDDKRQALRDDRYVALRRLWRVSSLQRVSYCRRVVSSHAGGVEVRLTGAVGSSEARAGLSGLQTCGSVWACPVCSEKVNAERRSELAAGLDGWLAAGNSVEFVTLTLRHGSGQSLARLWDTVARSWSRVIAGAGWVGGKREQGIVGRFDVAGFVRLVEVKHGEHGWHPHLHVLLFRRGPALSEQGREDLRGRLFSRWSNALAAHGARSLETSWDGQHVGVDVRPVLESAYVAEYLTKNGYRPAGTAAAGAAYEVTGSHSKTAGKGGRTPFEILAAVAVDESFRWDDSAEELVDRKSGEMLSLDDPRRRDLGLWTEWETVSRGRRQLTWSAGIRDLLRLAAERSDEAIVEAADLAGEVVTTFPVDVWRSWFLASRQHEILSAAEAGTLRAWMVAEGISPP